jgi:hypothetical protein
MFTNLIWWSAILMEALLLVRSSKEKLFERYPLFYSYIGCVLLIEVLRFSWYKAQFDSYQTVYWCTEFPTVIAGYGVIAEIYKRSLEHHPGVARRAQRVLLAVLFLTLGEVAADTFRSPSGSWAHAIAKFGRDLRYVELSLWIIMLAVFSFYRIPAGRNLKALISGYGFYITMSVVNLAFVFQPENPFSSIARQLPSLAYLVTLTIWCAGLWSRFPEPGPPAEDQIERDYRVLEMRTRAIFKRIKSFLERFMRP